MNFKKVYKLPQSGKDILYNLRIGKGKLARFLMALKDFGMEVRYQMNIANGTSNRQFLIACVVSPEEIGDDSHMIIKRSVNIFMKRQTTNMSRRYVIDDRITVLMNVSYWHGEARLLDPTGELWKKEADAQAIESVNRDASINMSNDILKELRDRFQNEYGSIKRPVLIIHSHLIPCTNPIHECAELIAAYAEKTDDIIIVSYDVTFKDTDTRKAIASLTQYNNIYLCHTREFRPYMNDEVYKMKKYFGQQGGSKTYSKGWNIESETLNRWTDSDQEVFPTMKRTNRRTKYKGTKAAARRFKGRPIKSKPKVMKRAEFE